MKKILFIATIIGLLSSTLKAQAPDFGFETWANVPLSTTVKDPVGWASFNVLGISGMAQSVFRDTIAPSPYAGSASVKVVTGVIPASVLIPSPFNSAENLDTVGLLVIGRTQFSTTAPVLFGYPYTVRSASLSFACRYTPNGSDSAYVIAFLTKWNGSSRDTIARGKYATGASTTNYYTTGINMVYDPAFNGVNPDSQRVYISSSVYDRPGAKVGSAFYVDALQWNATPIGINEIEGSLANVSVFPNPVSSTVTIGTDVNASKVQVMDISGRVVASYDMIGNTAKIDVQHFSNGLYIFNIYDAKAIIGRGRFEVVK